MLISIPLLFDELLQFELQVFHVALERLHQEDFCQALGFVSEMKYQAEGGPSLKQCFALLRDVSSTPVIDLARLLDAVIFNYLVGNNDAHGKNYSLLYKPLEKGGRETRFSSLYDIVSTVYYPDLTHDMAMKIGKEYSSERITAKDFEHLAEEAGLGKSLVRRRVPELADTVIQSFPKVEIANATSDKVAALIRERCEKARSFARERNSRDWNIYWCRMVGQFAHRRA